MTALADVQEAAARHGLRLLRAAPRGAGHLLLEVAGPDGARTAGQWLPDPADAQRVASQTRRTAPGPGVRLLDGHLLVQPGGADRRLPALGRLVRAGGRLVAHRPERRGVVVLPDGAYAKVLRPDRVPGMETRLETLGRRGVRVPEVRRVDVQAGVLTTEPLPGRTVHELLGDPGVTAPALAAAGERTGRVLRRLHALPADGLPRHDASAELGVVRRWLTLARDAGVPVAADRLAQVAAELSRPASGCVPLHRDLHDKQVLVGPDGAGLLDLDLLAAGDPALDLANLLVHLELRVRQGVAAPDRVAACVEGLLAGYAPSGAVLAAVRGYDLAARLRLSAVYAFRPEGTGAAVALLADGLQAGGDGHGRGANALAERFDVDVGDEDHRDGAVARASCVHHR